MVYIILYALLAFLFEDLRTHRHKEVRTIAWVFWMYITFMTFLRTKYEFTQFLQDYKVGLQSWCQCRFYEIRMVLLTYRLYSCFVVLFFSAIWDLCSMPSRQHEEVTAAFAPIAH